MSTPLHGREVGKESKGKDGLLISGLGSRGKKKKKKKKLQGGRPLCGQELGKEEKRKKERGRERESGWKLSSAAPAHCGG